MARTLDPTVLAALRNDQEVGIRAVGLRKAVIIWVVVVDDVAFVRSVRGTKGKWYVAAAADGHATLEVGHRQVPVTVTPATDPATIAAVSQAFLSKYATSPYAQSIVAPDTLPTTLRLDPI
jgi:hypothetical protein